jgi:hypothetical protein
MGSPISITVPEILLQHLENTHVKYMLDTNHILIYARYVDDILIVYDSTRTSTDIITHYSNSIHLLTYVFHGVGFLLEKLTGLQLVKKFTAFYGTRRFLTALRSARHISLFWASPIHSSHPHHPTPSTAA